jgi:hypothetical protein
MQILFKEFLFISSQTEEPGGDYGGESEVGVCETV